MDHASTIAEWESGNLLGDGSDRKQAIPLSHSSSEINQSGTVPAATSDKQRAAVVQPDLLGPSRMSRRGIPPAVSIGLPADGNARGSNAALSDRHGTAYESEDVAEFGKANSQLLRTRPIPCSFAIRFSNRPNGTQLSTIIEQNSYSTLGSYRSFINSNHRLLPVASDDSRRAEGNANGPPPGNSAARRRLSQSVDEVTLYKIREATTDDPFPDWEPDDSEDVRQEQLSPIDNRIRSVHTSNPSDPSYEALSGEARSTDVDSSSKPLKLTLKEFIQNVREASRRTRSLSALRSRPSIETLLSGTGDVKDTPLGGNDAPQGQKENNRRNAIYAPVLGPLHENDSFAELVYSQGLVRSEAARTATELDISSHHPVAVVHQHSTTSSTVPEHTAVSLSPTPSPSQFPSPPNSEVSSQSTTKAALHDSRLSAASSSSNSTSDDPPTVYTADGVSLYRPNLPSLDEYDCARKVSGSSSISTTYSSSIIGVDVDLLFTGWDHDVFPAARQRMVTPSLSESFVFPVEEPATDEKRGRQRAKPLNTTITSVALPSLLPLAAAAGILRPANVTTSNVSFYSPSGNLIQVQPDNDKRESPRTYFSESHEPPPRPALLPVTAPRQPIMPLPSHLRHRHDYGKRTETDIVPRGPNVSNFSTITSNVKGCDGIVRARSIKVQNPGTKNEHGFLTHPRSHHSLPSDTKHKYECLGTAPLKLGAWMTTPMQRRLLKGKPSWRSKRNRVRAATPVPTPAAVTNDGSSDDTTRRLNTRGLGIGTAAGWTLRVCFCQPFDEVGASCSAHAGSEVGG